MTQASGPRLIVNNEEERFSGNKHTTEYPKASIDGMALASRSAAAPSASANAGATNQKTPNMPRLEIITTVIAVGATGVCRSDWHAWKGHDPVVLPHIGGHEFAGVVVTAGPEVRRWRAGDRVTVPFACGCGRCEHCLAGNAQVCPRQTQPGFTGPGSFAELVAVHAALRSFTSALRSFRMAYRLTARINFNPLIVAS